MEEQVKKVLEEVRPILQADGGDVQLVSVDEANGVVKVALRGRCGGCPAAQMTLNAVIAKKIMAAVPGVKLVERV